MASPLAPKKAIPGVTPKQATPTNPNQGTPTNANQTNPAPTTGSGGGFSIPNPIDPIVNTYNAAASVPAFLGKLSNPYLWRRIGIVAIGVLMVWWAVLIFLSSNKKIQSAVTSACKKIISATPEGAAANVATGSIGL